MTGKTKKGRKGPSKAIAPLKKKNEELNMSNINEDNADIDFEELVRREYLKLQREYRLMEEERHHLAGAGNNLTKQAHLLEILRNHVEDLETDLYNANSEKWHAIDQQSVQTILHILELYEKAMSDTNYCIKRIREMVSHVDKITKLLINHQLKVQTIYGQSMTVAQADRRKKILEDRLYLCTTRFDTKLSNNKELRDEINMMLKLRGLFYSRHVSMKRQLARIRFKMTEIVFMATQAYEQRDELVTTIHNLRDKNDKDTRQHVLEIKEFHRVLHHDAKSREFNMLKNKERQMLETARQRDTRRNVSKKEELENTMKSYARNFKKILRSFEFDTLENLVKYYNNTEQANFARFVRISDINSEVTVLTDETAIMSKEIEDLFVKSQALDEFRQNELHSISFVVDKKKFEYEQVKNLLTTAEQQMQELLKVVDDLFKGIDCPDQPIIQMLGNEQPLAANLRNAIFYMKAIDQRARELNLDKAALELRKAVEIDNIPLQRANIPKPAPGGTTGKGLGGPYDANIPFTGRLEDEEEEDEDRGRHLFDPEEFRTRTKDKMREAKRSTIGGNNSSNISIDMRQSIAHSGTKVPYE